MKFGLEQQTPQAIWSGSQRTQFRTGFLRMILGNQRLLNQKAQQQEWMLVEVSWLDPLDVRHT